MKVIIDCLYRLFIITIMFYINIEVPHKRYDGVLIRRYAVTC